MDEMTIRGSNRSQMEVRIIESAENVPLLQIDWVNSQEFGYFIDTWIDLLTFYRLHTDTVIGLEAIGEYVSFMRLLRRLMSSDKVDASLRERAEEHLNTLEGVMEEIIVAAVSNLENNASVN